MSSASSASASKLSDSLSALSEEILPRKARQRVRKLFDELDQLLFIDNTGELAVDRDTLIRIASNEDLMPTSLRDISILETSKHLGRRVKGLGEGRRITWREGEKYGMPFHPLSKADLRAMGITKTTSIDELGVILKAQFPEIPEFWLNEDSTQLVDTVMRNFMVNRTVWDCLYDNLGYWAVIGVIGAIVVWLIIFASILAGPVGALAAAYTALVIAAIYLGFATAYFLLQCVINPWFRQPW